jgi:phosphonate transport system permease protein
VGAGGVGFVLQQAISFGRHPRAGMIILVIVVATVAVDIISGSVRQRIISGAGARKVRGDAIEQPELIEARPEQIARP